MENNVCLTVCSHDTANMVISLSWNTEVFVAFGDFLNFLKWKCVNVRFSPFTWKKIISSCSDYRENIKYVNFSDKSEEKERILWLFDINTPGDMKCNFGSLGVANTEMWFVLSTCIGN